MKDVSGELGLPVLGLVQLNRNRATRVDKRPQLADLRESGDLENTADSVLGLYRDEIDHSESDDRGLAELSVLKKRQLGEHIGTIRRLVWVGSIRDIQAAVSKVGRPWGLDDEVMGLNFEALAEVYDCVHLTESGLGDSRLALQAPQAASAEIAPRGGFREV